MRKIYLMKIVKLFFFLKGDSGNGLFDCKVLSRQHAMIIYEDERFFILDTGSSNGTFVNNIRLSKTGEESKMTEIFNGDIVRFGSDIVDKVNYPITVNLQCLQNCMSRKKKEKNRQISMFVLQFNRRIFTRKC